MTMYLFPLILLISFVFGIWMGFRMYRSQSLLAVCEEAQRRRNDVSHTRAV